MTKILKYFLLIIICPFFISFTSCEKKSGDPFEIQGQITGLENKKLLLETFSFPNINGAPKVVLIDSVTTDASGKFIMKNYLPERTMCRLKPESSSQYYVLLSLYEENIELKADVSANENPVITGSEATAVLYDFIDQLRNKNTVIMQTQALIMQDQQNSDDSLAAVHTDEVNKLIEDYNAYIKNFADTTKEISNAIIALESFRYESHFDQIKEFSDRFANSPDSSHTYIKEFVSKVTRYQAMMNEASNKSFIGKPAPEVEINNPEGNVIRLSSLKGKIVLLDFWASWCGPCRRENPNVVNTYNKYKDKGFTVYSVSLDKNKTAWMDAIKKDELSWENHVSELQQWNSVAAKTYHVTAIPSSFLLDENGVVVAENLRGPELEQKVKELVEKLNTL